MRGVEKFFAIFDIIARYISVTVQNSPIIDANDYKMVKTGQFTTKV